MIVFERITAPVIEKDLIPVTLTDETIQERKDKLLAKMKAENFDVLVIYADLEHGSNFEYLMGFVPRFEEAMLIIHKDGNAYAVLGNENLNKAGKARIEVTPVHMPHLSLPNQPMPLKESVSDILKKCDLSKVQKIGVIGWKNFTSTVEDNTTLFDLPYFLIDALKKVNPSAQLKNATSLMVGANGIRTTYNANELAHYEFGTALSGRCMLEAMEVLDISKSEMEVAAKLSDLGQYHSVVTIMSTGQRFEKANLYPTDKKIKRGDAISMTTGYKGGLESRSGYAVFEAKELPKLQQDYLEKLAIPYFTAFKTWVESIKIGMTGDDLYQMIEEIFPKRKYGWSLNPGHLSGDEEWLASPIYEGSKEKIKSGMLFQVDIIPSIAGYAGASCESSVFLADKNLQKHIKKDYPMVWKRIMERKNYLKNVVGLNLGEEVLPMSAATGFYRPFLLNKEAGLKNI